MPVRVDLKPGGGIDPGETPWGAGSTPELETAFVWGSVALSDVASPTASHDILPTVIPAPRTRRDVVEGLGGSAAVLTLMAIPTEYCTSGDRHRSSIRNLHISIQTNDRGQLDRQALRIPDFVLRDYDAGLLSQNEHESSPLCDYRERLVTGVEY